MKNQPLILSILLGIILLFIIGGLSISARLSSTSKQYKEQLAEQIELQKTNGILQEEKDALLKSTLGLKEELKKKDLQIEELIARIETLESELEKLKILKQKLEENLQEALMQSKSTRK
ncbi:MAG: hypothetical protein JXD21_06565 [Candidatus Omnitrophica bacterium]|nr:hypothetical protein [Candidatus Omnitrophota bacterium]